MFKKLTGIVCAAVVTVCGVFPAFASSTPPVYKVSDNDGHSVYMMGTFHYSKEDSFPIEGIDKVLDDVDTVAFEICGDDMDKIAEQLRAEREAKVKEDKETNGLSDEVLDEICGFINSVKGKEYTREELSTIPLDQIKSLINTSVLEKEGLSSEGTEEYLNKLAKERNLKTVSIEDPQTSLDQLKSHTEKEMGIKQADKEEAAEKAAGQFRLMMLTSPIQGFAVKQVLDLWGKGDVEEFTEAIGQMEDHSEEMAARDALFCDAVKNYLANGEKTLVAVGSAHVFGVETGMLKTLTEEGYSVERI